MIIIVIIIIIIIMNKLIEMGNDEKVVMSSMNAGSALHLLGKFNVKEVWDYLIEEKQLTIFMAVPTIYGSSFSPFLLSFFPLLFSLLSK